VFLTLIVNGSTTQLILRYLGMDSLSAAKVRIFLIFYVQLMFLFWQMKCF